MNRRAASVHEGPPGRAPVRPAPAGSPGQRPWVTLGTLLFAFALTGVCLELLGPILPTLSLRLGLNDTHSGLMFTALFTANSFGALLVRGNFAHSLAAGLAVTTLGAAGLVYATPLTVLPLFAIFGLGLGLAMTAVSLFASRHFPHRRASTIALLNFAWSGGAALAPLFVARQLAHRQPQSVFAIAALASAIATALVLVLLRDLDVTKPTRNADRIATTVNSLPWKAIAFFAAIGALETGVETTIGGWLSTYAHRIEAGTIAHAAATASFFWTAFLAGRGIVALLLLRVAERLVLAASLVLALAGIGTVLMASTSHWLAAGAVIAGLALAAIFPVNLTLFLARVPNPTHAGWMLACTGIGGSILPWLTGAISTRTGSLHTGLFVPAVAIAIMLAMVLTAICNRHGYLRPHSD